MNKPAPALQIILSTEQVRAIAEQVAALIASAPAPGADAPPVPTDPEALLNEREASEFLGLTQLTLYNWRNQAKGPAYLRLGTKSVRYRRRDLLAWLAQCEGKSHGAYPRRGAAA